MEEGALNQAAVVGDWKRRFQKETKDAKHQLEEEKLRSQELRAQLLHYQRREEKLVVMERKDTCSNCELRKDDIARLKRIIADTDRESSLESFTTSSPMASEDPSQEKEELTPESTYSEYEQDGSDDVQPKTRGDSPSTEHQLPYPFSPREMTLPAVQTVSAEETLVIDEPDSNQTDDDSHVFTDLDDACLGDLFKYAVVLAGPARTKPNLKPRLSFSDRFKSFDVQRNRNPQECTEQCEHQEQLAAHEESTTRPRSAPVGKWKAMSPNGGSMWSLKRQSLDNVNEDKVPSPLRRAATGLFSNLVPNGFRGGSPSSAPTTPPLPPPTPAKPCTPPSTDATPASKLLCVYPSNADEVQELEGLLEICFPYGEDPPSTSDFSLAELKRSLQERHRTYRSADSTFVLTIASASNPTKVTYAICVRCPLFPEKEEDASEDSDRRSRTASTLVDGLTQCCLCLLSPYPFFGLFFKVLYGIAVLWNSKQREALASKKKKSTSEPDNLATMLEKPLGMLDFVEVFQGVMERLKGMQIPSMGGWSRMSLAPGVTQLAFHRPHSSSLEVERRHLLLEYAAPTLFRLLSVDQVLFLLGCLCCERKVLVVSDHVNVVSSCVLALITLLYPLQWAGPVITVLPPRLNELLEAPVPLIAGRVSINSASIRKFSTLDRPMKDVIEMNMDQNALHMHDEDLITYHELKLPECDELVHELEPFSALLFGKHESPDFPTVQQDEACKIICARIHHHIDSICALATAQNDGERIIGTDSPDKRSSQHSSSPSRGSSTRLGAQRRCSAMVADYINRFQETQMFSMFTLQVQDARNESDEGDGEHDDSENDERNDENFHYEMEEAYETSRGGSFEKEVHDPEGVGGDEMLS